MTNIDKQRVDAVRKLERLGYRYDGGERVLPASATTAVSQHSIRGWSHGELDQTVWPRV